MKAIKIYTQDSKYYMEDLHTGTTHELTNPTHVKKDNTDWFKLPENSCNRSCVCKQTIDKKVEINYGEKTPKTTDPNKKTPKSKIDLNEYYTDEERTKIEKLQAQIDKIKETVTKRAEEKIAEKALMDSAMGLTMEQLIAIMEAKKAEAKA